MEDVPERDEDDIIKFFKATDENDDGWINFTELYRLVKKLDNALNSPQKLRYGKAKLNELFRLFEGMSKNRRILQTKASSFEESDDQ